MVAKSATSAQQSLTLSNELIRLTIRPDLGGRIDQLYDCQTQHSWLWHPATYDASQTRSLSIGASFDDNWTGGWDEVFPNDAAGQFRGRDLVDHGELWSQAWDVIETSDSRVKLRHTCKTVPVVVEKVIQLAATQAEAKIEYWMHNQSNEVIPFLFKQHAAIAIAAGDEILLPDCQIEPAFLEFSKIIGRAEKTRFPHAFAADGRSINVKIIPSPESQLQEFYYSSDLATGECGIRSQKTQSSLIMRFDRADFPYVWVFQSYGGWRDHFVLVMEPCTTIPFDLEVACQNGTTAQLQPQETQHRTLTICIERSA